MKRRDFLKNSLITSGAIGFGGHNILAGSFVPESTHRQANSLSKDYAKAENRGCWLRHPVYGDPSFDAFEKLGDTVHRSAPPYEWAVNGSVFRDFDGVWYLYAGLYGEGYISKEGFRSDFVIYRSKDRGATWEYLGPGFPKGFKFDGHEVAADGHPDVVLFYDKKLKKYLLTYDGSTNNFSWAVAHTGAENMDSGAALALADSPAGPFTRLKQMFVSNAKYRGLLGRFTRMYFTTVIPRENDYVAFILCDSGDYYSWSLACMTATDIEGPWSEPHLLLSVDSPCYYPAPVEFQPVMEKDGVVYAPATSVAQNRNYQALFSAPLKDAADPAAWKLLCDGGLWHARPLDDEYFGIWGQTFHGFIEPDTKRFIALYPSRNKEGRGTINVAACDSAKPFSDGFTISAHGGASISPLLASYRDFSLEAEFTLTGTAIFAWNYQGVLTPNDATADSTPAQCSLAGFQGLRISGKNWDVRNVAPDGKITVLKAGIATEDIKSFSMSKKSESVTITIGKETVLVTVQEVENAPIALILEPHTILTCSRFAIEGEARRYTLMYGATEAILGAGQAINREKNGEEVADKWHKKADGIYVGKGNLSAKWNFIGDGFTLYAPKSPDLGDMELYLDGRFIRTVRLHAETEIPSAQVLSITGLSQGAHALRVLPRNGGRIAIDRLEVTSKGGLY
ncbi:MAG: hypothetical protein LBR84_06860 [Tannerella sp.]|jgi:hypothetical protein|nr:hypothetical protein [Tannerella sp.]